MAEHFSTPPNWEWWIALYFFFAGIAGGTYVIATILRWRGSAADEATARAGFMWCFPLVVVCGALLTIDLGRPLRFYHMLIDTTPGAALFGNFKPWSPISLGSWALLLFSLFSFVSFLQAYQLNRAGNGMTPHDPLTRIWNALGSLFALFLASYTGVVLSVSNQPVWSDSWALGALFVASGLSAAAAFLLWLGRSTTPASEARLERADGYFAVLEAIALVVFFVTLAMAGTLAHTFRGIYWLLWILVLASLIPPLMRLRGGGTTVARANLAAPVVVMLGVLLMRITVIFSAQY